MFKCDETNCGKEFRKLNNFNDHIRVHTNERPFKCHYPSCSLSFTQRGNLIKHIEIHEGVKRYSCPDCSKKFYTNFNLNVILNRVTEKFIFLILAKEIDFDL